jgi:hypothetical protein
VDVDVGGDGAGQEQNFNLSQFISERDITEKYLSFFESAHLVAVASVRGCRALMLTRYDNFRLSTPFRILNIEAVHLL